MEGQCSQDWVEQDELINNKGVCRTDPATTGVLKICMFVFSVKPHKKKCILGQEYKKGSDLACSLS